MKYNIIAYSTKIWITALLVTPAIYTIERHIYAIGNIHEKHYYSPSSCLFLFLLAAIIEWTFSLPTWLIFMVAIVAILKFNISFHQRKWIICAVGVLLAAATFTGVKYLFNLSSNDICIPYWLISNTACIGLGCWLYKLEPKDPLNEVETVSPEY